MTPPLRTLALALWTLAVHPIVAAQGPAAAAPPPPARSALVVVDAQVGVLSSVWESARVIGRIEQLVRKARSAGVPVVWVQHEDDELKPGSDAWRLLPNFVPAPGETVLRKRFNSAFADTDLDPRLKALGVRRVVLAGGLTNWCIRATAHAAVDRGYDLTLVGDAHSTEPMRLPDGRLVPAEFIVADLNTVFRWLAVPVVRTEVTDADAVSF